MLEANHTLMHDLSGASQLNICGSKYISLIIIMTVISLGGVGGCQIAGILRKLNYLTYPYDWLICAQSFVIDSFLYINNFFTYNNTYVYDTTKLISPKFNAIMLHDFNNYLLEEKNIINKYNRRFERLYNSLENKEPILFIRYIDNLSIPLENMNQLIYGKNL